MNQLPTPIFRLKIMSNQPKERILSLEMSPDALLKKLKGLENECRDNRNVSYLMGNRNAAATWEYLAVSVGKARSALKRGG